MVRKLHCYICDICRIVLVENWIKHDGKDYCRECFDKLEEKDGG